MKNMENLERGKAILQGRDKGNKFGIECPYCHATNVSKNYHCDHCGSDF